MDAAASARAAVSPVAPLAEAGAVCPVVLVEAVVESQEPPLKAEAFAAIVESGFQYIFVPTVPTADWNE